MSILRNGALVMPKLIERLLEDAEDCFERKEVYISHLVSLKEVFDCITVNPDCVDKDDENSVELLRQRYEELMQSLFTSIRYGAEIDLLCYTNDLKWLFDTFTLYDFLVGEEDDDGLIRLQYRHHNRYKEPHGKFE